MGYTHYFTQRKRPTKKQWDAIMLEVGKLFATKEAFKTIRYEQGRNTPPVLHAEEIRFNGRGENAHETFMLLRDDKESFQFCKTARKPYDLFVVGVLTIVNHFAPNCYDISSDGWADDWQPCVDFLNGISFEKYEVPKSIEARRESLSA